MNNKSNAEKFLVELKSRNLIYDCTNYEKLIDSLSKNKKIYLGIDPTAPSLHLGNYLSLSFLKRAADYGFSCLVVVGDLTAQIGDPSFKTKERPTLTHSEITKNIEKITHQIKKNCPSTELICNSIFYKDFSISEFLSQIAKYINVNFLLAKDFLKDKLETGITVTEFLYPLFQSYDFFYLFEKHNVSIQIGGSDQWGNITSGIEFIRKKTQQAETNVVGLTFPLLLDENNKKFGKSEGNALFLDEKLTKPYFLYKYLLNISDSLVVNYLKSLTFISIEEIENIEKIHFESPNKKHAQKTLAFELLKNIHSEEIAKKIKVISENLFSNNPLNENDFEELVDCIPTFKTDVPITIETALKELNFSSSNSETRRLLKEQCISGFNEKITNNLFLISPENSLSNYFFIKKGKKDFGIIVFKK